MTYISKRTNIIYPPRPPIFPEIPQAEKGVLEIAKVQEIVKTTDLEKIVALMGANKFFDGISNLEELAKRTIQDNLELKGEPKPFFLQLKRRAKLEAQNNVVYEEAITITEASKAMGILETDIECIHPGYVLGLAQRAKMGLMSYVIDTWKRINESVIDDYKKVLQGYGDYAVKLFESYIKFNQGHYESMSKIYESIATAHMVYLNASRGSNLYQRIEKRAYEISQRKDREKGASEENWKLAQQELVEEDIKKQHPQKEK